MRRYGIALTNEIDTRQPDWPEATRWLNMAVEKGDSKARAFLAELYMLPRNVTGLTSDPAAAYKLLTAAAAEDLPEAYLQLSRYLDTRPASPSPDGFAPELKDAERTAQSEDYLRKAVAKNVPMAHMRLALKLREQKKYSEALDVLVDGSRRTLPDPRSLFFLSDIYSESPKYYFFTRDQAKSIKIEPDAVRAEQMQSEAIKIFRAAVKGGDKDLESFCVNYGIFL